MDPLSFLRSIVKFDQPTQPEPLKLHTGQIINGKVIRFLPNEMAVIQIGSQKIMAKLQASLIANQQYWFEVQSEAGKIHLKLLKGNMKQVSKETGEYVSNQNDTQDAIIEQIFTQVPLQVEQENIECSIQWNGRKMEDGKINPDNCRILFFADLKNIGEVLIDLQFQNRRIQMVIINGTRELERLAQSLLPGLKENLQKLNFQLASVRIEPPPAEKSLKALIRKTNSNDKAEDPIRGMVDIRV
jgi:hypothetical protein